MAVTRILLKKSGVKGKLPDATSAEYGELFLNYHSGDPMLCFKDNAGEIVQIKPARAIDGGGGELPPDTGNEEGDTIWDGTHLLVWDGTAWVPVGPNDLAYVTKTDGGTITNSAGSDVDIPYAHITYAGLINEAPADSKQYARIDGAWSEVDIPPATHVGDTAPNSPITGQLWFDTDNGQLLVWNGSNWVPTTDTEVPATGDFGFWNRTVTTLSPVNAGDDVDIGSGNISLSADGTASFKPTGAGVNIDSSGRLLVGASSSATTSGRQPAVQIFRNNLSELLNVHLGFDGALAGARILLSRSRNTTHGGTTILQDGDEIGGLTFIGDDGVDYNSTAARVFAQVDGTPGANDMPGRLIFSTTASGDDKPTEKLRIDSSGNVSVIGTGTTSAPNISLNADGTAKIKEYLHIGTPSQSAGSNGAYLAKVDTNSQLAVYSNVIDSSSSDKPPIIVLSAPDTSTVKNPKFVVHTDGTTKIVGTGTVNVPNISLNASGSATFAGTVTSGGNFEIKHPTRTVGNLGQIRALSSDGNPRASLLFTAPGATGPAYTFLFNNDLSDLGDADKASASFAGLEVRIGGQVNPDGPGSPNILLNGADGSATFTGNVDAQTFSKDGTPFSVEDINAARETFQELQIAVQNAADFASLKAAMLVALEDWSA